MYGDAKGNIAWWQQVSYTTQRWSWIIILDGSSWKRRYWVYGFLPIRLIVNPEQPCIIQLIIRLKQLILFISLYFIFQKTENYLPVIRQSQIGPKNPLVKCSTIIISLVARLCYEFNFRLEVRFAFENEKEASF
jgi:hypothetical protein